MFADTDTKTNTDPNETTPSKDRLFCQVFLGVTLGLFVAIAATNFVVNPYAQYAPKVLQPLVQTSRAQKVELLDVCHEPEGLILGSSRVLKFEPDYLQKQTGLTFFNAGVNYGKPEDFLALFRYWRDTRKNAPKMLIVGVDVIAFTDGLPPDARLLGNSSLACRVPEAISVSDRMQRWRELLSWQQSRMSLSSLKLHLSAGSLPVPVESFRNDGLIVYHQRESELKAGTYDFQSALDYTKNEHTEHLTSFKHVSAKRRELFAELVSECKDSQTQLRVFLTPLHPELADHLLKHTNYSDRRDQVSRFLSSLATRHQFEFQDLSDVNAFAGDPTLFVDGIHPLEPNTRRMIDLIVASEVEGRGYAVQ